ncbi:MAG: hypothetical protein OXC62_17800 [Aestuariivita sp.]|nr:hypothetical protein [Aestuariivita sp.]
MGRSSIRDDAGTGEEMGNGLLDGEWHSEGPWPSTAPDQDLQGVA